MSPSFNVFFLVTLFVTLHRLPCSSQAPQPLSGPQPNEYQESRRPSLSGHVADGAPLCPLDTETFSTRAPRAPRADNVRSWCLDGIEGNIRGPYLLSFLPHNHDHDHEHDCVRSMAPLQDPPSGWDQFRRFPHHTGQEFTNKRECHPTPGRQPPSRFSYF